MKQDEFLACLRRDEAGATAIEYGLIAGLIALVIVGALGEIGAALATIFTRVTLTLH